MRAQQRYQVTANVPFRSVSSAGAVDNVRCADATQELPVAEMGGRTGFQTDFRVRAANESALVVTVERR